MAVLTIWGTIAFKIFNGLGPSNVDYIPPIEQMSFSPKTIKHKDTFNIKITSRDPFLGNLTKAKKTSDFIAPSKKVKTNYTSNLNISYNGIIKKNQSNERIFVININNKQYLLKKGQQADSVKLINGNDNSVTVRYKGVNSTIILE